MKNQSIVVGLVFLLFIVYSGQSKAQTVDPADVVVALVNETSADTLAEAGDVEHLSFTALKCDFATSKCTLVYSVKHYALALNEGKCELQNITGFDALLDVVRYGFVLKAGIYEQISDCMRHS